MTFAVNGAPQYAEKSGGNFIKRADCDVCKRRKSLSFTASERKTVFKNRIAFHFASVSDFHYFKNINHLDLLLFPRFVVANVLPRRTQRKGW